LGGIKVNKGKGVLLGVLGLVLLFMLISWLPFERQSSGLTEWLYYQGEEQEKNSNELTEKAVEGLEGEGALAGEHEDDGSNWSIPNILRHWLLGE